MVLSIEDGKELILLARQSINSHFSNEEVNVDDKVKIKYSAKQGVFVTLNLNGELRGCIGYPEPILPLYEAIIEAAKSAAFSDRRSALRHAGQHAPVSRDAEYGSAGVGRLTVRKRLRDDSHMRRQSSQRTDGAGGTHPSIHIRHAATRRPIHRPELSRIVTGGRLSHGVHR